MGVFWEFVNTIKGHNGNCNENGVLWGNFACLPEISGKRCAGRDGIFCVLHEKSGSLYSPAPTTSQKWLTSLHSVLLCMCVVTPAPHKVPFIQQNSPTSIHRSFTFSTCFQLRFSISISISIYLRRRLLQVKGWPMQHRTLFNLTQNLAEKSPSDFQILPSHFRCWGFWSVSPNSNGDVRNYDANSSARFCMRLKKGAVCI